MRRVAVLSFEFVEFIPKGLEEGVLYVSMPYATATHKCCCGCGNKVVTPLSATDWELTFNGESVSLNPSIGNWSFPCQSHYWIRRNEVQWAPRWSEQQIKTGRAVDTQAKEQHFGSRVPGPSPEAEGPAHGRLPWWRKLIMRLRE